MVGDCVWWNMVIVVEQVHMWGHGDELVVIVIVAGPVECA